MKNYRTAKADYTKVLQINPRNSKAYIKRGMARSQLKDYRGSYRDFDTALKIDNKSPYAAVAYAGRALSHLGLGNKKAAIADLRRAQYLLNQFKRQSR